LLSKADLEKEMSCRRQQCFVFAGAGRTGTATPKQREAGYGGSYLLERILCKPACRQAGPKFQAPISKGCGFKYLPAGRFQMANDKIQPCRLGIFR